MPYPLKISEAASLGLHSMGLLAHDPSQPRSTRVIAETFSVSEAHLSKVLQRLVKVGLLKSGRGPKGGFSLARDPKDIRLLDVYEATEGPVEPMNCLFALPSCDGRSCALGSVLGEANDKLWRYLGSTTVADISQVFDHERFSVAWRSSGNKVADPGKGGIQP